MTAMSPKTIARWKRLYPDAVLITTNPKEGEAEEEGK